MIQSMTAFASRSGASDGHGWAWDMRGVNARGLDLRLRLPDGIDGLEAGVRAALSARFARGNISLTLRMIRDEAAQALAIDAAQVDRVLAALDTVQDRAMVMGITLGQPTAADVLGQRGVILVNAPEQGDMTNLAKELLADLDVLLEDFTAMRQAEGAALTAILTAQLDQIDALVAAAKIAAAARLPDTRAALTAALRRLVEDAPEIDEARVAQELALLAVKADITEEIDRLGAHVAAARALLADAKPAGRRLDFLMQEFNREANTLCAKAGSRDLTAVGLDLKAVIDQMREQIQNVE